MNGSLSKVVGPIAIRPITTPVANMTAPAPTGKAEKAAREFESMLLTSLFDSLQKSFAFDAKDDTAGASDYRQMGTRALAEAISERGGIGIARLILSHLQAPDGPKGSGKSGTGVPPPSKVSGDGADLINEVS
jgi:Rod binding domain-containing protein